MNYWAGPWTGTHSFYKWLYAENSAISKTKMIRGLLNEYINLNFFLHLFFYFLFQSPAKGIIRPIAFKPVVISNHNYVNTRHFDQKTPQQDDGYGSQDYPMTNQNVADMSHGSLHMDSDRSTSYSSDSQKLYTPERPESTRSSCISHASSMRMEGYIQTPSPSDSGVGELEAMLKEKDAEINTLRDVMDKNERAIFQVGIYGCSIHCILYRGLISQG